MAALIESVAVAASHRPLFQKGALQLADEAASECLHRSGRRPAELDLLVNAGVYRERCLAEPALAAMIQEDLGSNAALSSNALSHGTFSFDVANGGAGVVTAIELISGFIASRTIDLGLVVASDSNPGIGTTFPFPNAGGAALLRPAAAGAGFTRFLSRTYPEHAASFESHIEWRERPGAHPFTARGENVLVLNERSDFAPNAGQCASAAVRELLEQQGLRAHDIDLLVASAYPRTFALDLAQRLELSEERVAQPDASLCGAHTAGILGALEPAWRSGQLSAARHALFVAVGAGITVAAALYRHE
jgi:3-oxoacyl-[acyl-carrier-protein] synthase-3